MTSAPTLIPAARGAAIVAPRAARRRTPGQTRSILLGIAGLATVGLIGEVLAPLGIVRPQDLPPTSTVLVTLGSMLGEAALWRSILDTVYVWALGLLISVIAGVVLGLVLGSFPTVRRYLTSTIEFLRPIPSVALIPLVVLLYGPAYQSALVLVVYASFWQVLIQTIYGVLDVDPVVAETARSYRFTRIGVIRYVVWPSALPFIMTGIRLASTVALVLTVTAQLIIGTPGIGQAISLAEAAGNTPRMYALVLVTAVLGLAVNLIVRRVEKSVLSWHTSARKDSAA